MNPLTDAIPARYRKYLYAVLALTSLVYGAYEASGQDWAKAAPSILVALVNALAASNTDAE